MSGCQQCVVRTVGGLDPRVKLSWRSVRGRSANDLWYQEVRNHQTAEQICNLSAVMNRGRLQPRLPPQAQMDESGLEGRRALLSDVHCSRTCTALGRALLSDVHCSQTCTSTLNSSRRYLQELDVSNQNVRSS
ncbi:unnamed protein product [Pleuronectes platessa]|uniref:Uncharacterized protein n=1 Tax=Pleuronectes platessa TaxID=8262 RepID=A0A9N7VBQ3_PLEPL|nr:unnamed protein product [Pleuronectes platessa]